MEFLGGSIILYCFVSCFSVLQAGEEFDCAVVRRQLERVCSFLPLSGSQDRTSINWLGSKRCYSLSPLDSHFSQDWPQTSLCSQDYLTPNCFRLWDARITGVEWHPVYFCSLHLRATPPRPSIQITHWQEKAAVHCIPHWLVQAIGNSGEEVTLLYP